MGTSYICGCIVFHPEAFFRDRKFPREFLSGPPCCNPLQFAAVEDCCLGSRIYSFFGRCSCRCSSAAVGVPMLRLDCSTVCPWGLWRASALSL